MILSHETPFRKLYTKSIKEFVGSILKTSAIFGAVILGFSFITWQTCLTNGSVNLLAFPTLQILGYFSAILLHLPPHRNCVTNDVL